MDSRRGKSRGKSNRPLKRSLRRAVAWLLVFCMCMANMNSAAFAAEIATASNALMAATPSDAKATDSDAMENPDAGGSNQRRGFGHRGSAGNLGGK